MSISFEIEKCLKNNQLEEITKLILNSFNKFIAPDYSREGIETFYKFIDKGDSIKKALEQKELCVIAKDEEKIRGMLLTRNSSHISLLFVDENYHSKGIAKKLLNIMTENVDKNIKKITVNSSPYAVAVYEKLGFIKLSELQERDGIEYIAMEMNLEK